MISQIFVNLPVKELEKSKAFYAHLGFTCNLQFTDENAASMVMSENIFVMLLTETFFKTFTKKSITDSAVSTEVINAIAVESREQVDELVAKALEAGGTEPRPSQDYGWMYSRAFEDLDGHTWEPFYMNMSKMPATPDASASA